MRVYQLPKQLLEYGTPHKKPVGELEVDWSNSLTKGLVVAVVQQQKGLVNLVDGAHLTTSADQKTGIDSKGIYNLYNSNSTEQATLSTKGLSGSTSRSAVFGFKHEALTGSTSAAPEFHGWGTVNSAGQVWAPRINSSGLLNVLRVSVVSGTRIGATVVADGGFHACGYSEGTGDVSGVKFYIDGVEDTYSTTSARALNTSDSSVSIGYNEWGGNSFSGNGDKEGKIYYQFIWNRDLSESEHKDLARDPYQLVKAKTPPVYFTLASSGGLTLAAGSGSYTFTGSSVNLERGLALSADSGGYSYSGTGSDLSKGSVLALDSGSYTYIGTNTDLLRSLSLGADSGAYTYSGTAATLTFTGAGSFELAAESGAYTYSGSEGSLLAGRNLAADSGTYSYTGTAATLSHNMFLVADSGAYSYSGANAALTASLTLSVDSGKYAYTGTSAVMAVSGQVVFGVTMYPLTENREMILQSETRSMMIDADNRNMVI